MGYRNSRSILETARLNKHRQAFNEDFYKADMDYDLDEDRHQRGYDPEEDGYGENPNDWGYDPEEDGDMEYDDLDEDEYDDDDEYDDLDEDDDDDDLDEDEYDDDDDLDEDEYDDDDEYDDLDEDDDDDLDEDDDDDLDEDDMEGNMIRSRRRADSTVTGQRFGATDYQTIGTLFDGEDLSEEFKNIATELFEDAVVKKAKEITDGDDLSEDLDATVTDIIDKVDGYLNYVTEEWIDKNEDGVESLIKTLKGVLGEDNTDSDTVHELETRLKESEDKYDRAIKSLIDLREGKADLEREIALDAVSEDLTKTEIEKLCTLTEDITFENAHDFASKLNVVKKQHFSESWKNDDEMPLEENSNSEGSEAYFDEGIKDYVKALNEMAKQ